MGLFGWPRQLLIGALQALIFLDGAGAERDLNLVHNYITRPGLKAPKWNVTVYDKENLSPGYIFVAPYEHIGQTTPGEGWIGPHIYDQNGGLIWSGADLFGNMSVQDFRISKVLGQDRMSLIRPELRAGALLDDHFEVVKDIPVEGFNMHDFNFVDDGKSALLILRGVMNSSREDAIATGLEEGLCSANFHGIAEYDVATWQPTWQWFSKDHIGLNESNFAYGLAEARCDGEWDYMHANAVDKCPDGDLLLSGRHTDAIYKISKATGDIVWRLGGQANDFEMIDGLNFSRQHDVRCRSQNETTTILTILDNAKGEDPQHPSSEFSRGLRIAVNTETMQATLLQHFDHPSGPGSYAHRRGNYQQLPNEHVVIGWSEQSHLSEHSPDGALLMEMVMVPHWVGTYRSYKFEFVGRPKNPPDVHAEAFNGEGNTTNTVVYVSWNGATEVDHWRLYKSGENGDGMSEIMRQSRSGFETQFVFQGYAAHVTVEAVDSRGEVIGRKGLVTTIPPPNVLTESVVAEQVWLQQVAKGFVNPATDSRTETTFDIDVREATAFAGGFVIALILVSLAFAIFYVLRLRNISLSQMQLPWHQQQQHYQPLDASDKSAFKATITSYR